jgi:hypothetical protein
MLLPSVRTEPFHALQQETLGNSCSVKFPAATIICLSVKLVYQVSTHRSWTLSSLLQFLGFPSLGELELYHTVEIFVLLGSLWW